MSSSSRRCQIARARSGPIPAGSPSVNANGCTILLWSAFAQSLVFYQRLMAQLLQIGVRLGPELFLKQFIADFLFLGRVVLGLPLAADCEHLHALRHAFRRRQMTDIGA